MTTAAQLDVIIGANTRDLDRGLSRAERGIGNFARRGARALAGMSSATIGIGASLIGTASTIAIEWESAWANVEKTVSGTDAELQFLEDTLRNMATDEVLGAMDNAHQTLAGIAASAGALGVETGAIDEFTASVAALSIAADDVSAEEIATAAAQFANVAGMDVETEIDNWAAAIARLGNEGATTEGQIISFSNRLAALGAVGFDETEILGYSAAMASLGLTAELGGTNFMKSVTDMVAAIATGGPKLAEFADIAGMTADEFQELGENNPEEAFNRFIEGLSALDASEQIVQLQQLGITSQEQQRVLMTLASGIDTVQSSLLTSKQAWYTGNDAMEEATRKAETTQGAISRLGNVLREKAIEIGNEFTPHIELAADALADLVEGKWVGGLNDLGTAARGMVDSVVGAFNDGEGINWEAWGLFFTNLDPILTTGFNNMKSWINAGWASIGDGIVIIFDNLRRRFQQAFLGIQIDVLEHIASLRSSIIAATTGSVLGTIDIAPNIGLDLTNLRIAQSSITVADELTAVFSEYLADGVLNSVALDATSLSAVFGSGVTGIENFINFGTPEEVAAGFGVEARETIRQALELAIAQGDAGALEVLTPLAAILDIDIAQMQADLQAAVATQHFPVTVTADMNVVLGTTNMPQLPPVLGAGRTLLPAFAGGGMFDAPNGRNAGLALLHDREMVLTPEQQRAMASNRGAAVTVNAYGRNPYEVLELTERASRDRGYQ